MKEIAVQMTGLEFFFLTTTIISFVVNIIQFIVFWQNERRLRLPVVNALLGLFNDVKSKVQIPYQAQQLLWNQANPHKDIETLKWEYWTFAQNMIHCLQGFQETLVSVLVTINPKDREGEQAFRATEYGLKPHEKEFRAKFNQRLVDQQLSPPIFTKEREESTTDSVEKEHEEEAARQNLT